MPWSIWGDDVEPSCVGLTEKEARTYLDENKGLDGIYAENELGHQIETHDGPVII